MWACEKGNEEVVKFLLENKKVTATHINAKDNVRLLLFLSW